MVMVKMFSYVYHIGYKCKTAKKKNLWKALRALWDLMVKPLSVIWDTVFCHELSFNSQ